jgi:hypothetical protein
MSYRFANSLQAESEWKVSSLSYLQAVSKPVWHIPLLCLQCKTPDDGQRNRPKNVEFYFKKNWKISASTWFYFKKFITMHGHMNVIPRCTVTWTSYHDALSHERHITMHGHMNVISRCTVTWTSYHDARSHERHTTMHGHMKFISRCTVTWTSNRCKSLTHVRRFIKAQMRFGVTNFMNYSVRWHNISEGQIIHIFTLFMTA